ncbi:MAG: methionyl-tRNA formyltransferase [bacterium]|nr:methionyl-tRNA formyltransferase [bacterium]
MAKSRFSVVFFGTPELAVPFLHEFAAHPRFDVKAVVTQPDRPAGRKHLLTPPPVKIAAEELRLIVHQTASLKKNQALQKILEGYQVDLCIAVAIGLLLPLSVLKIPRAGTINMHPSLLPKFRGPSPVQSAILADEKITGISVMLLDEGMDTGPILKQMRLPIGEKDTTESLYAQIQHHGPRLLSETALGYLENAFKPTPQDDSLATQTFLLKKTDGKIDWRQDAASIARMVRAFVPWPGAYFEWQDQKIDILQAEFSEKRPKPPGYIFENAGHVFVATGKGSLKLKVVKPSGKKAMSIDEFVRGRPGFVGSSLS